ncbi:PKHD-type hydroxylase Bcep18194_B0892 [Striga asiatica]|uniref:PKHD-type hydroxylase Bcep18194_B0892 n=1 Tax=Striga asiatica TaxID=4170 RepID=A0A5A7QXR4_STRAF|nr:PKHD-type hydroxylase Bcep18194_B0892 [Striga asiatica]
MVGSSRTIHKRVECLIDEGNYHRALIKSSHSSLPRLSGTHQVGPLVGGVKTWIASLCSIDKDCIVNSSAMCTQYSLLGCEREGASELNQSRTGDYPELYTQWKAKRKKKSALKAIPKNIRTTRWRAGAAEALRFACSEMRQRSVERRIGLTIYGQENCLGKQSQGKLLAMAPDDLEVFPGKAQHLSRRIYEKNEWVSPVVQGRNLRDQQKLLLAYLDKRLVQRQDPVKDSFPELDRVESFPESFIGLSLSLAKDHACCLSFSSLSAIEGISKKEQLVPMHAFKKTDRQMATYIKKSEVAGGEFQPIRIRTKLLYPRDEYQPIFEIPPFPTFPAPRKIRSAIDVGGKPLSAVTKTDVKIED